MDQSVNTFTPTIVDKNLVEFLYTFLCWRENIDMHEKLFVIEQGKKFIGIELYTWKDLEHALDCLREFETTTFEIIDRGLKTKQVLQVKRQEFPRILIEKDYLLKHCKYFVLWYERMPESVLAKMLRNKCGYTASKL